MATIGYWSLVGLAFGAGLGLGFGAAIVVALFVISILYNTFTKMYE